VTGARDRDVVACERCGASLAPVRRPAASVALGGVEVALPARTVAACPRGHGRTEAADVRAALARLTRARPGVRGGPRCGACRAALDLPQRTTARGVTVEPAAAPPYTVELRLPMVRCPDCAVDNVPVGLTTLLRRAVRTAVRTAVR
jgi:uncharacterized protein with PIN domain